MKYEKPIMTYTMFDSCVLTAVSGNIPNDSNPMALKTRMEDAEGSVFSVSNVVNIADMGL